MEYNLYAIAVMNGYTLNSSSLPVNPMWPFALLLAGIQDSSEEWIHGVSKYANCGNMAKMVRAGRVNLLRTEERVADLARWELLTPNTWSTKMNKSPFGDERWG
jgi:hypothetical protein